MKIKADTREQDPYSFERFPDVEVVTGTLESGDYSLPGAEHLAAIERKTLDDLTGCLTKERERFEKELHRLRPYHLKAVIVEATLQDLARGYYKSQLNPQSALQSVIAFQVRYAPFVWAGNRQGGEYFTHGLLSKWAREITKQYEGIHHG